LFFSPPRGTAPLFHTVLLVRKQGKEQKTVVHFFFPQSIICLRCVICFGWHGVGAAPPCASFPPLWPPRPPPDRGLGRAAPGAASLPAQLRFGGSSLSSPLRSSLVPSRPSIRLFLLSLFPRLPRLFPTPLFFLPPGRGLHGQCAFLPLQVPLLEPRKTTLAATQFVPGCFLRIGQASSFRELVFKSSSGALSVGGGRVRPRGFILDVGTPTAFPCCRHHEPPVFFFYQRTYCPASLAFLEGGRKEGCGRAGGHEGEGRGKKKEKGGGADWVQESCGGEGKREPPDRGGAGRGRRPARRRRDRSLGDRGGRRGRRRREVSSLPPR
jgi:hypothetical protein